MKIDLQNSGYLYQVSDNDIFYKNKKLNIPSILIVGNHGKVFNQGTTSFCGPYTIKTIIESQFKNINKDINLDVRDLYNKRTNKPQEGMIPRDLFKILKEEGVKCGKNNVCKLLSYERLQIQDIKEALIINGPVFLALKVCSNELEFWKGNNNLGDHAIALIGYNDNKKTFLLKNSYGIEWGNGGYIDISYNDLSNALLEAWTCESKLM